MGLGISSGVSYFGLEPGPEPEPEPEPEVSPRPGLCLRLIARRLFVLLLF